MIFSIKLCQKIALSIVLLVVINTCSGKPEKWGRCELSCSGGAVATSETVIQPLTDELTINCNGATTPSVVEANFLISAPSGKSDKYYPRSNILVKPLLSSGTYDPSKKFHEEPEFKGIATPKSEWCSDKCGVVKISLWVECKYGFELEHALSLVSGAGTSDAIGITASSPIYPGEESPGEAADPSSS